MQSMRSISPPAVAAAAPSSSSPPAVGSFQTTQQQELQQQQLLHQQQSASRRLIARFTSGLASKPRSIGEFTINLDEPHRQYSNGDVVKGHVKLQVLRPIKITHIVISLAGFAHVYKNPGSGVDNGRNMATLLAGAGTAAKGTARGFGRYHGNGIATLFEDEMILCGDGRLGERTYQFNFELQFPKRELPSSIDFERGTISYSVTATMTRPTTISPTSIAERRVTFLERIDIAHLLPPKPRTVILDPIVKRSKAKSQAMKMMDANDRRNVTRSRANESGTVLSTGRQSGSSQDGERALSPVPSEVSEESRVSSNGVSVSQSGSIAASPATSFVARPTHSKTGSGYKAISTVIQPVRGGCLRGDQVAVNIKVNHSKYMKSMNGVIVTLYRTARVDTQPALSVGALDGSKHHEEYFSRSFTGLGGLSLSGAGTAHIFRKDIAQVVKPLVINPSTLTAEVVAKLRVPEEAFPTISGVPGAMISFKYYLEVIVDIQGRLAGPDKPANGLTELTSTTMTASDAYEIDWSATTTTGQGILNTTHVRRDKGVVSGAFEVVVGTLDSERSARKGKQKAENLPNDGTASAPTRLAIPSQPPAFDSILGSNASASYHIGTPSTPDRSDGWASTNGHHHYEYAYRTPSPVPLPHLQDESQLSEKERIRLAEIRLLPSQPPGLQDDAGQSSQQPTAPRIFEDGTSADPDDEDTAAPCDEYASGPLPHTNNGVYHNNEGIDSAGIGPSIHRGGVSSHESPDVAVATPTEDKQELERSRLQALASAPPTDDVSASYTARSDASTSGPNESNSLDSHAEAVESADLPRYER